MHHDGSVPRVVTAILTLASTDLRGGHTVWPILPILPILPTIRGRALAGGTTVGGATLGGTTSGDVTPGGTLVGDGRADAVNSSMWDALANRFETHQSGPLGELLNRSCDALAEADARGSTPAVFGLKPVAGDLYLFYQQAPAQPGKADRRMFHAGCPVRGAETGSRKWVVQHFLQVGGIA